MLRVGRNLEGYDLCVGDGFLRPLVALAFNNNRDDFLFFLHVSVWFGLLSGRRADYTKNSKLAGAKIVTNTPPLQRISPAMTSPVRSAAAAHARLREMAFHHFDRCHEAVTALHVLEKRIAAHPLSAEIWNAYDWLLTPFTLWPIDVAGLVQHVVKALRARLVFDPDLVMLLQLLEKPPADTTQIEISAYEKKVHAGEYDSLVKQPQKFAEREARLRRDAELLKFWNLIKARFPTKKYEANKLHVIRRSMSQERNFRPGLKFRWKRRQDKFAQLFDALCHRWQLYGMQGDMPLLLKISVNPTPHGTMIVIPRHWSFDKARDLDWRAISKLHRAHGVTRQGPKLSTSRIARMNERERVGYYMAEAKRLRLRGEARHEFICTMMRRSPTADPSWYKRLLKGS